MPRLADLRQRFQATRQSELEIALDSESLIFDPRSGLTPNQIVDHKFGTALLREHGQREADAVTLRTLPR